MNTNWKANEQDMEVIICNECQEEHDCDEHYPCSLRKEYYKASDFAQEKLLAYLIEYSRHCKLMLCDEAMRQKLEQMMIELKTTVSKA